MNWVDRIEINKATSCKDFVLKVMKFYRGAY